MTVIQPLVYTRDDSSALPADIRIVVYVTTIVGGTIIIASLLVFLYKRNRRLRALKRQRLQEELAATSQPRRRSPQCEQPEHPAQPEVAMVSESKPSSWYEGKPGNPLPVALTDRFRRKDAYVKATLGEAFPMHLRSLSMEERSSLLSEQHVEPPTLPPIAHVSRSPFLSQSFPTVHEDQAADHSERSLSSVRTSRFNLSPKAEEWKPTLTLAPPKSRERWSWTNSEAPATPRMYAPTLYSSYSKASATRFRMAVNWVRTRGERITSGESPSPANRRPILPKPGVLKNQASKPNLAPNKLVKKASLRRTSHLPDVEKGPTL